jgi:hypothetical protein
VASAPDTLTLKTHRDQEGRKSYPWIRRALLGLLALVLVAALFNAFGQRPATTTASASEARLRVYAPTRARSGLTYAARFRIDAQADLKNATLILAPGWAEQYTVNGVTPQPETEGSSNGRLVFGFGHVPAGHHVNFWLSLQVNPTTVGHRAQTVTLADGDMRLATVHRTITIFP